ncbi:MAG TPA: S24 family peptidase [Candidatus Saccharimonadales bacterium]|nr:S24 family peptidase [Candidatus Saccharimonadales bacterium]
MNETQKKILELAKSIDISSLGVRELARRLGVHPQAAKYHKEKLERAGLLKLGKGLFSDIEVEYEALGSADLLTIPFLGAANCGPATLLAGSEAEGKITLSSRLLCPCNYRSLFAVKADGDSMNQASIGGRCIEDGDFIVVDANAQPQKGDYVVAVVNNLANIKRYYPELGKDGAIKRIALISESTESFEPIFIHPDDEQEGLIAGVVLRVIEKPQAFAS